MKKIAVMLPVLVLLAGALVTVDAARTHVIRYGDTLWDLSIRYYNTPFHWEDILEANPTAEVRYLMPGEELMIPDIYATHTSSYDSEFTGAYITSATSSRSLLSRLVLETAGMVTDDPPDPVSYIIDTDVEEMDEFSDEFTFSGDLIAIDIGQDQGVEINRVYKIYERGEEIRHPRTGALIGNVIRVAGVCRVIDTDPSSSIALLEHCYIPVNIGDFLVPYSSSAPVEVSTSDVVEELDAYVLAFRDKDLERAYSYDVVYIDRGSEDGLQPGDIYTMYKYGETLHSPSGEMVTTPDVELSELIILDTRQETSAAMIFSISTSELISVGDRIEIIRKQM